MKLQCSVCGKIILSKTNSQFMPQHKEVNSSSICKRSGNFIEDDERITND